MQPDPGPERASPAALWCPFTGTQQAAPAAPHFMHITEKSKCDGLQLFYLFTAFVQAYFWQGSRQ